MNCKKKAEPTPTAEDGFSPALLNSITFNLKQVKFFFLFEIGKYFQTLFDQTQVCVTGGVVYLMKAMINSRY